MERIKAVADEAEEERNELIRKTKKEALAIQERTGVKRRIDYRGIQGGAGVVNQLLGPTTSAVAKAIARYKKALQEQTMAEA